MHDAAGEPQLPWKLLGVHSVSMGMDVRGFPAEQSLGLNWAWDADILHTRIAEDASDTGPPGIAPGGCGPLGPKHMSELSPPAVWPPRR